MTAEQLYRQAIAKAQLRWQQTLNKPVITCRMDLEQEELIALIDRLLKKDGSPL